MSLTQVKTLSVTSLAQYPVFKGHFEWNNVAFVNDKVSILVITFTSMGVNFLTRISI